MKDFKLRIAIVGYGKMGKSIERLALYRGHDIVLKISSSNKSELDAIKAKNVDVAIEFSSPAGAYENLTTLASQGVNTVCGTTGWTDHYDSICDQFNAAGAGFLHASNFSVGVNVLFAINEKLASLMSDFKDYGIGITEAHHITKRDAPSGTALSLANQILKVNPRLKGWAMQEDAKEDHIPITSLREGDVKGLHEVTYSSAIDALTIRHEAFSREGFTLGAVLAAEFLAGKSGIHKMNEVLGLPS